MIEFYFNEAVQPVSISDVTLEPATKPIKIDSDNTTPAHFTALFEGGLTIGDTYTLIIRDIHDIDNNINPYLESLEGVSLARINIVGSGTESSNWISGSSNDNYATPGYNSSQLPENQTNTPISIEPRVINPNGNGIDDFTTISLSHSNLGSLVTLKVYNLNGRLVKELTKNMLVTNKTRIIWDGTDYSGGIVSLGHYFIVSEVISSNGTTEKYRDKIVVATGF
jgi:hypothetical protein